MQSRKLDRYLRKRINQCEKTLRRNREREPEIRAQVSAYGEVLAIVSAEKMAARTRKKPDSQG
jgi:hypothetical protein